jgi:AbrB family looped-hinge helix DNA binding protein
MKTTIDGAGRIVIPKAIRKAMRLEGGEELEVRVVDHHIEIESAPNEMRLVRKGNFVVSVPVNPPDKLLTAEEVEEVRRQMRDERELF